MKPFIKKITKKLICILAAIILIAGTIPYNSRAATDMSDMTDGLNILEPVEQFVVFLCDSVMQWLQNKLVTTDKIAQDDGTYNFQYSPAIIFSGKVPAFDVNFISPAKDSIKTTEKNYNEYVENQLRNNFNDAKTKKNTNSTNFENAKKQDFVKEVSLIVKLDENNNIRIRKRLCSWWWPIKRQSL